MITKVLPFFWPPLAWRFRVQEFEAQEVEGFSGWYRKFYLPWLCLEHDRMVEEFRKEMLFRQFVEVEEFLNKF